MKGLASLLRMVRHRWWVVLLVAVLGAAAAFGLTSLRNAQIDPAYEAVAVVPFATSDAQRDKAIAQQDLVTAGVEAAELTSQYIDDRLGKVTTDTRASTIVFTARGRTEGDATETATAMRQAYIDGLAAKALQERQDRLDEIVTEAADILAQIELLDPPEVVIESPDVPTEVANQLAELQQLASALTSQRTGAEVDLILAETGDDRAGSVEEIQVELDAITVKLDEVYAEIAAITAQYGIETSRSGQQQSSTESSSSPSRGGQAAPAPVPEPSEGGVSSSDLAEQWTVEALNGRYNELSEEYASFFTEGNDGSEEELVEVTTEDVAPAEGSPILYSFLGAFAGAALAIGALFAQKRVRGHIYAASDVAPIPVLTELPPVSSGERHPDGRRQQRAVQKRLEGVRRLRSTLLTYAEESPRAPAIGLSGVGVDGEQVRLLALDVARRLVSSDRSVVLLDLDFGLEYSYETALNDVSVAGVLSAVREDPTVGGAALGAALSKAARGKGALHIIRSGRMVDDPSDLVLTDGFRTVTDQARGHADIILVVLPDAADSLTKTVSRRFDGMIAVCAVGVSRRSLLANAVPEAALEGSQAVGIALLTGRGAHHGSVRKALDDGDTGSQATGPNRSSDPAPAFAAEARVADPATVQPTQAQTRSRRPESTPGKASRRSGRPDPVVPIQILPTSPSITPVPASGEPASAVASGAVASPANTPTLDAGEVQGSEPGRVKRTLDRVESALENHIALPGAAMVPEPGRNQLDRTQSEERGRMGRAFRRVEAALERFIAPPDPTPASGGWTASAAEDRG